jgi:hypothetical protein
VPLLIAHSAEPADEQDSALWAGSLLVVARLRSLLAPLAVHALALMLPALRLRASPSLHPLGFRGAPLGAALRHALLQFPQHFAPSASIEVTLRLLLWVG